MRFHAMLLALAVVLGGCLLGFRAEPEKGGEGLVLFDAAHALRGLRADQICQMNDEVGPPRSVVLTSDLIRQVVAANKDAVVNVYVRGKIPVRVNVLSIPLPGLPAVQLEGEALGSGFVCSSRGYVLTNAHVVRRAVQLAAKTADGTLHELELVAVERASDLALLHVVGSESLPAITMAPADRLAEGDWVVAIGNPLGLTHTVSHGIVSQKSRVFGRDQKHGDPGLSFIQSDTPINPGNSGGPLIDLTGNVVGMNTAIAQGAQGISFTIPTERIRAFLEDVRSGVAAR